MCLIANALTLIVAEKAVDIDLLLTRICHVGSSVAKITASSYILELTFILWLIDSKMMLEAVVVLELQSLSSLQICFGFYPFLLKICIFVFII